MGTAAVRQGRGDDLRLIVVGLVAGLATILVANSAGTRFGEVVGARQADAEVDVAVAGATVSREPSVALRNTLHGATVHVRSDACHTADASGVVLRSGLVLTNTHALAGGSSFDVVDGDASHDAGRATVASGLDLAAGAAPTGAERSGLALAETDPLVGDTVYVAGHPDGGPLTIRGAAVAGARAGTGWQDPATVVRLDVVAVPGDSGSPVVDAQGRLVGLVYAAERGTRSALVIPVSVLKAALLTMEPASPRGC